MIMKHSYLSGIFLLSGANTYEMIVRRLAVLLLCGFAFTLSAHSEDLSSVKEVIRRVTPWMEDKVEVFYMECPEGVSDAFEISTRDGKLVIRATSVPAAGQGFNHYLKYYCNRNYTLTGSNLDPVEKLPVIRKPLYRSTRSSYRHFMNFCAQNYSASFWNFQDWEKAIDFMVLNGVNMAIATVGLEKVWYNTLQKIGFTEKEIFDFLPGPAYNAWHMMANLEGWGGPITQGMIEKRADLARKVLERMRACGISPIYLSFYGMVPRILKDKHPYAEIIPQGKWVGGFDRPSILSPMDPLYDELADIYYGEVRAQYGDFRFFAGEPFHEGGVRAGIDAAELSRKVLSKMREHNKGAVWVLQGWSGNPTSRFLSGLSRENDVLIWDFRGELSAEWEQRKGYEGYPFLWGVINNFGETPGLYGRLEQFMNEFFRAESSPYSGNMYGLGVSPEGILNNPVNFDFLFEMPWHDKKYDLRAWTDDYVKYRYGSPDKSMEEVWHILLETAYSSEVDSVNIEPVSRTLPPIIGNGESMIAAAPSMDLQSCSSWGSSFIFYDRNKMKGIVPLLVKSSSKFRDVDAFQYDLVNFTRQLLSNEFKTFYAAYQEAFRKKDAGEMEVISGKMLEILDDMDLLLSTRKEFMVGSWIRAARDFGDSNYEKELADWNARSVISYWGPDNSGTDLRDYAHKEWSGLIRDLHKQRWMRFFEYNVSVLNGENRVKPDYTQMSIEWSRKNNSYPDTPSGDPVAVSLKVLKKHF